MATAKKKEKQPRKAPKTNSRDKPMGYCTKTMERCVCEKNKYRCSDCHTTNAQGVVVPRPEYEPDSTMQCSWTGKEKSYHRHNMQIHDARGYAGWRKGSRTKASDNPFTKSRKRKESDNPYAHLITPSFKTKKLKKHTRSKYKKKKSPPKHKHKIKSTAQALYVAKFVRNELIFSMNDELYDEYEIDMDHFYDYYDKLQGIESNVTQKEVLRIVGFYTK
eukprot:463140_1